MNNKTKTGKTNLLKSLIAEGLTDNQILERMKKEYPKITFKQEIFRVRQALAKENNTTWPGNQPEPKKAKRTTVDPKQLLLDRLTERIIHYQKAYNSILNLPDDIFQLMDMSVIEQKMDIPATVKEQQPAQTAHTQVIKSGKTGKTLNKKKEYKQLIDKLVSFRSEHQLTQKDVAQLTGIPESTVSSLEAGKNTFVQSKTKSKLNELFNTYQQVDPKEKINTGIPGNSKF